MSARAVIRLAVSRTMIGSTLRHLPLLPAAYARYAMRRADHGGLQAGLFDSFEAAMAAVPTGKRVGWNHDEVSSLWLDQRDPIQPSSYPVFFWLSKLLQPGTVLVDLGGSIGLTYYAYRRLAGMPVGSRWHVVEVPALAARGREVAAKSDAPGLEFGNALGAAPAADVLLAAGALQYMPRAVPGLLESLPARPRHVLVNKAALTSGDAYWTLQNFGPAAAPYRVWNEASFLEYFAAAGYRLQDRWMVAELSLDLPFYPRRSIPALCGFYFKADDAPALDGRTALGLTDASTRNSG